MIEETKHHDSYQQRREHERLHRKTVGTDIRTRLRATPLWRYMPFEPRRMDDDDRN